MRREQSTGLGNLDDLVADMATRAQRPRVVPREALGQLMQNAFGGIGTFVACAALGLYIGMPYAVETSAVVAAVSTGIVMFVRSFADEALDIRKLRAIQTAAKRMVSETTEDKKRLVKKLSEELDRYELLWMDEQRAHADTKHLLSLSRVEIAQLRDQLTKRTNYVAPAVAPPQTVTDANRLLSNYYATGEWTSRRRATEAPLSWTEDRYRAACDQLRDAGIIVSRNTRTDVTPKDLATATEKLNNYLLYVDTNRPPVEVTIDRSDDRE